jgi:TP901 family phage tail tape measure protein
MAGVLRRLVTEVVLKSTAAVKGLKAYDALWKTVAKSVDASATAIERSADRAAAAMGRVGAAAAGVRANLPRGGGGGGSGGGGGRGGKDPLDAVVREAKRAEREAQRRAAQEQRTSNRRAQADASQAGLAAGAKRVTEATAALGTFAKASDKARAKVADLSAQVERNRREMAELKKQALQTGDADGTLAARMKGLAAATGIASRDLAVARKELRGFEGGLIQAIKQATVAKVTVQALGTAIGNAMSGLARGVAGGVAGALGESAKAAMGFEKALVDVAKVAQDADLTKEGLLDPRVKQGIKDVAKDLGVMPTEVAELTAQITAAFSGKTDIVALASDVTKIGVAWDISGKQAGEFFKQTSAGLQINADETKALFGSVNELGNKLGIKSSEIAEAMTRSAGVLKGANISGETGAALNATLIKAGASAEVAATGVRTFIARLGAGEAATDKQITAFKALGLNAKEVAKNLASGDAAKAEAQIKEVVGALVKMGEVSPDKRMATLIQLFGSESIGSIGAAASAVDTLAGAFDIAGDKAKSLTSVQAEYDRVSNTTASRVEKLKANIGVLAIELGEALLPYIDKVVNFLTSPEGQKWGADAVETAKNAVVGLASAVQTLAGFFAFLIDNIGGVATAVGALGLVVASLAGPWGIAGAAATAALGAMVIGLGKVLDKIPAVRNAVNSLFDTTDALIAQENANAMREKTDAADDAGLSVHGGGPTYGYAPAAAPAAANAAPLMAAGMSTEAKVARFNDLVARRKSLKPSEAKELRKLSKELDMRIPTGGKGHKATKMDKQLAAMDPALASVLRRGGDEDAGGDLKVHDDVLSKVAFAAANKAGGGLGGIGGGSGGVGPGPSIITHNYFTNITVQQAIDARSTGAVSENIRGAGYEAGTAAAGVIVTGIDRARALKQGGGRMA